MSPTTTFEDDVRAMLARRAADVPSAGGRAGPPLPTGLRIPVAADPTPRRGAWLAVAAAVLVVVGALGLARAGGDDRRPETAATTLSTSPSASTTEPRPLQLDPLPVGVNPVAGPILGLAPPQATPEAASDAVVGSVLDGGVSPDIPYSWEEQALPPDRWASYRYPTVAVDGRAWPDPDRDARSGSVVARRDDAGWHVVAVTSRALDLRDVRRRDGGLAGAVWATSAAPLRVTVSTLAGEVLADAALTTAADTDPGSRSVLRLDDIALDGDEPVVVAVEAGDRPGQIGIDGVRAAAFSAVALPADADPAPEASTTTVGPPPDTVDAVIGVGHRPLPLDSPVVTSVGATLPPGARILSAEHTYVAKPGSNDDVILHGEAGGAGFRVLIARHEIQPGPDPSIPLDGGTGWVTTADAERTDVVVRSSDGVGVQVTHVDTDGSPEPSDVLIAIAEALVADPVVRSVAAGGDPAGT